jgi:multidrug efflux pump subunit AcrA (membrane-fusion protein)
MNKKLKSTLIIVLAAIAIAAAIAAWWALRPAGLPAGIVSGNGRIEATEIDIATKTPGRVVDILAREGDFVQVGAVLARMDTQVLLAQQDLRVHACKYRAGLHKVAFPRQDVDDTARRLGGDVDFGRFNAAIAGDNAGRQSRWTLSPPCRDRGSDGNGGEDDDQRRF